jgi:predicted proteasome-type protease
VELFVLVGLVLDWDSYTEAGVSNTSAFKKVTGPNTFDCGFHLPMC